MIRIISNPFSNNTINLKSFTMGSHPINLIIRFVLELLALLAVGFWAWKSFDGALQYILGIGLPILMTIVWGTFAVPDDPSRSGTWKSFDGALQYILGIGLPILMTIVWGTFAVPDDPSRSGKAPIPVSGSLRLLIELLFFAIATWALYDLQEIELSSIFGGLVIIHYLVSYDRISWLLSKK